MTTEAQKAAVAKYDKENTIRLSLKLNKTTDADILEKLEHVESKQGYIKELIRRDLNELILISERIPEDGTWNLFTDGKNWSVERYKCDAIDHFYPPGRWFNIEDIVAWMPLPDLSNL